MGDRLSDSSYEGTVEEASEGIKADVKTLNQLSSSGRAAQQSRIQKALNSLDTAAKNLKDREGQSGSGGSGGSTQQQGRAGGR